MAITSFVASLVERGAGVDVYRLLAVSNATDAVYYWYREGVLVGQTRWGELVVSVESGAGVVFEVLDDVNAVPAAGVPEGVLLTWDHRTGAVGYEVRDATDPEDVVVLGRVQASGQRLVWQSGALAAGTRELQIVPVFERGQEGPARVVSLVVVRRPGAPAVSGVSYDGETGELVGVVG